MPELQERSSKTSRNEDVDGDVMCFKVLPYQQIHGDRQACISILLGGKPEETESRIPIAMIIYGKN
jgi:hypothetical protein